MSDAVLDMQKARRETLRWLVLDTLHACQEVGASEIMVQNTVQPVIPDVGTTEIRKALDYLADRGLIDFIDRAGPVWQARINHHGIDVVEYTVDCHPGIARPRKW